MKLPVRSSTNKNIHQNDIKKSNFEFISYKKKLKTEQEHQFGNQ